ncbi:hypothetical protein GQ55_9G307800 [Panicum hallii var. hallii]|uniref:Uncharacterized protein n=1 Tax=Panicum hallii var. hallii TaxID=1504633 RepID=A0A2T7C7W4_9POAL|nr:hypothetical protein GQ55_9G307800 [Panicum hallii var. hallii]
MRWPPPRSPAWRADKQSAGRSSSGPCRAPSSRTPASGLCALARRGSSAAGLPPSSAPRSLREITPPLAELRTCSLPAKRSSPEARKSELRIQQREKRGRGKRAEKRKGKDWPLDEDGKR